MKNEFDKLFENHYGLSQKDLLGLESLCSLIEEQMQKTPLKEVKADEDFDVSDMLPTAKITEAWGTPGTKDKEYISEFTSKIAGDTLEAKLNFLNNVVTGQTETTPKIGEILATLMMIEILNSILGEFTESAGGFIFEGFLAGLFGDAGIQIVDVKGEESDATGKPITDVVLGGKQYSLKLLGPETDVKGSFRNMVEHFKTYKHVIYLDARRTDEGLDFGEFIITLDNFLEIFVTPFLNVVSKKKAEVIKSAEDIQTLLRRLADEGMAVKEFRTVKITKAWKKHTGLETGLIPSHPAEWLFKFSPSKGAGSEPEPLQESLKLNNDGMTGLVNKVVTMNPVELQKYAPFSILYTEAKFEGTKAEKLFGNFSLVDELRDAIEAKNDKETFRLLEMTPGYRGKEQFIFTRKQAESIANFQTIATLQISEDSLKQAWLNYADILNETLKPVYGVLNLFTKNVNSYFLGTTSKGKNRKSYGQEAISNAGQLKVATDNAVTAVEKAEK